jgi:hypothetical protein
MPEAQKTYVGEWLMHKSTIDLAAWIHEGNFTAYEHPYGFTVVRVHRPFIAGWEIRLHFWPPEDVQEQRLIANRTADQQVHAHGWKLWSRVFWGALSERTYSIHHQEKSILGVFVVQSDYGTGHSRLMLARQNVEAEQTMSVKRTLESGPYMIAASQLHSTSTFGDKWALSLVATEVVNDPTSTVVGPSSLGPTISNERKVSRDIELLSHALA